MRSGGKSLLAFAVIAPLLAAGCARAPLPVPDIVKPYRITIQQGNYVSREMVEQLKPGMTREQVRFILGTPLVTDIFHADRWDYVFYRDAPGEKREQRSFSVVFEDGKLARVVGDLLPSDAPAGKPAARPEPVAPKPAALPAQPEAQRPAAEVAPAKPETTQNWTTASDATPPAEAKPAAAVEPKAEARPEEKSGRGFFGRMLEKIGF